MKPLVPAISAEDGQWIVKGQFMPVCKPGGHGVIWKLAYDKCIFGCFHDHGRKGATVRQVRLGQPSNYDPKYLYQKTGLSCNSSSGVCILQ